RGPRGWRRCSSLKYSRYSRSSRLAIRAPRSAIWSSFSVDRPLDGLHFDHLHGVWVVKRQAIGQLRGLQHSWDAVDRLQRLDLFAAVCRVIVLELARLDEDVPFERPNCLIVGIKARFQFRPQRVEVAAKYADRLVQVAPEIADFSRVLLHRLLLPAIRHRPQQRNQ